MANGDALNSTTQQFLDIYDITNDLVILKDGTTSLILTVDAINFGLLAEEEQDSIMYAYAGLLNSLNYPIQIVIRSQTKDVTGYLRLLKEQEDSAKTRLQQQRIMKYREFVSNLIRERNVLDKKFYIAIPAKPLELGLLPVSSVVPGQQQTDVSTMDKTMVIEKARNILEPKRDHLVTQFARIGLYSRQLETQEIIQLFYQSYNPEAFEGQNMDDSKSYTAPLVSASIEGSPMDMQDQTSPQTQQQVPTAVDEAQAAPVTPEVAATPPAPTPNPDAIPAEMPGSQPPAQTIPDPSQQPVQRVDMGISKPYTPTQMTPPAPGATPAPEPQMPLQEQTTPQVGAAPTDNIVTTSAQTPVAPTPPTPPSTTDATQAETLPAPNVPGTVVNQSEANPLPNTTNTTPLPPAPELPKTAPGQVDGSIPQETEIKIEHPGEKPGQTPDGSQPVTPTPQQPSGETQQAQSGQQSDTLPPLPEIQ